MAKGFKLRILRVIQSFQVCRFTQTFSMVKNSVQRKPVQFSTETPVRYSSFSSIEYCTNDIILFEDFQSGFRWRKEEKWLVITKVELDCPRSKLSLSSIDSETKKKMRKKKKCSENEQRNRAASSSSSEGRRDSQEYYTPKRLSVFKPFIPCIVEGKVKESFAIVKKSEDPYCDFKRSMAEMIIENQIFEVGDLEKMLLCFLSLNSRDHHEFIVRAFSEIWVSLFCKSPRYFASVC